MREAIAAQNAVESLSIEGVPAFFEASDGARTSGTASVLLTRASITIRFAADGELVVPTVAAGESCGVVGALDGGWKAHPLTDAGLASDDTRLFGSMALILGQEGAGETAATRLIIAGTAWEGSAFIAGRRTIAQQLSREVATHHDVRMSITVEGDADAAVIAAMERACSFVAGTAIELLSIERYSSEGALRETRHRREHRRLGRAPHSPFAALPDEYRMRAWSCLVEAHPRLLGARIPIDMLLDQIAASNQGAQIHIAAQLLLLATGTAAHQHLHGNEVGEASASRHREVETLNRDLRLNLGAKELERYDKLRVELLDAGFFHKPGYETGRPQKDIKFLRDLAHRVVLRLAGYSGPFYSAEFAEACDVIEPVPVRPEAGSA